MARLTLILSDLYLPQDAERDRLREAAVDLPNLDWLVRFCDTPRRLDDWRSWLAMQLNQPEFARPPMAAACARVLAGQVTHAWLATPVHLEARLDHVRLADRGLLRVADAERRAWCDEFARVFGPQYSLHDAGERGFILGGVAPTTARTLDPARLLDSDIGGSLPRGPEAAELRRLGAEIEMWLHRASLNARRERAGERPVSALWLWAGGTERRPDHSGVPTPADAARDAEMFGGDPFLLALGRSLAESNHAEFRCAAAPASLASMSSGAAHSIVELTPMTGRADEALQSLDAHWFAPVRQALSRGALDACDLVVNDRHFHIRAGQGWKFWRRRTPWIQNL